MPTAWRGTSTARICSAFPVRTGSTSKRPTSPVTSRSSRCQNTSSNPSFVTCSRERVHFETFWTRSRAVWRSFEDSHTPRLDLMLGFIIQGLIWIGLRGRILRSENLLPARIQHDDHPSATIRAHVPVSGSQTLSVNPVILTIGNRRVDSLKAL